jgi:prepilin-type N-terminal cleavage/methylation domain-containing protein
MMARRAGGLSGQKGLSLIEVLIAMMVTSIALVAFVQSVKPTISGNKSNRKYIDITSALSEVLDSVMTQPVSTLDLMGGTVVKSRQKLDVKVLVAAYSQAQADAMMAGLDVSRMRKLTVKAVADTMRTLSATVSNYQESAAGKCFP